MSWMPMQIAAPVIIVGMQHLRPATRNEQKNAQSIGSLNHSFLSKGATLRRPMLPITDVEATTRAFPLYGLGSGSFINWRGRAFQPAV
jgi:hypothetical protein